MPGTGLIGVLANVNGRRLVPSHGCVLISDDGGLVVGAVGIGRNDI